MTDNPKVRPRGLSKSKILQARQCPKRLWLQAHRPELGEEGAEQRQRLEGGTQFGELARALLGSGRLIEHFGDLSQALVESRTLIDECRPGDQLFEAALSHDGVLVRADALERTVSGWVLTEVKSSTEVKPHHLEDVAVQAWVTQQAGLEVREIRIGLVDNQFVYRKLGDYEGLLKPEAVDAAVQPLLAEVDGWVAAARKTLAGDIPEIATGPHCSAPFECPFYGHCRAQEPPPPEFPVESLPHGGRTVAKLLAEGFRDLREVPLERLSSAKHRRIAEVARSGKPFLDPAIRHELAALPYPRRYLDFETIGFAVPRWIGTRPYQQVPFQFSCHIESAPGAVDHAGFLELSGNSPIAPFADALLEACGEHGPIVVYNASFEVARIRALAAWLPDRAPRLLALIDRIYDLLPAVRDHYYHPAMQGSFSIKAVLPTLAPELDYANLEGVQDGAGAQEAFLESIAHQTSPERRAKLRQSLEIYCARDTEAMLRLSDALQSPKPDISP